MKKKILAVILSVVLLLNAIPFSVFAATVETTENAATIFTVPDEGVDGYISYNNSRPSGATEANGYHWGVGRWTTSEGAGGIFRYTTSVTENGENFFKYTFGDAGSFATTGATNHRLTFLPVTYELNVNFSANANNTVEGGTYAGELYGEQAISALYSNAADYNYIALRFKMTGGLETTASTMELYFGTGTGNAPAVTGTQLIDLNSNETTTVADGATTISIPYNFDGWIIVPSSAFSTTIDAVKRVAPRFMVNSETDNWDNRSVYFGDMMIVKDADAFRKTVMGMPSFELTSTDNSITVTSTDADAVFSLDKDAGDSAWLALDAFNATLTDLEKDTKYTIYAKYVGGTKIASKEIWTSPYSTHKGDSASYFMNVYDDITKNPYITYKANISPAGIQELGWPSSSGTLCKYYNDETTYMKGQNEAALHIREFADAKGNKETFIEFDKNEEITSCVNQAVLADAITYGSVSTSGLHSSIDRTDLNYMAIRIKIEDENNKTSGFYLYINARNMTSTLGTAYMIDKATGAVSTPDSWKNWNSKDYIFEGAFDGWVVVPLDIYGKDNITNGSSSNGSLSVHLYMHNGINAETPCHDSKSHSIDGWDDKILYLGDIVVFEDEKQFKSVHVCGAVGHTGGTATCTEKAVCEVCGESYGTTHPNTEIRNVTQVSCTQDGYTGDTWCLDCNTQLSTGKVVESTGEHIDVDGKLETSDTQHFYTCSCGETFDVADHTGKAATCKEKAVCSVCGVSYGELDTDNHIDVSSEWSYDETQHYHSCSCGGKLDVADHTGGTATEIRLAVCEVCGASYGELDATVTNDKPIFTVPEPSDDSFICYNNAGWDKPKGAGYYWGLTRWTTADYFSRFTSVTLNGENFFTKTLDDTLSFATAGAKNYNITFLPATYELGVNFNANADNTVTGGTYEGQLYGEQTLEALHFDVADYNAIAIRFKMTGGSADTTSTLSLHCGVNEANGYPADLTNVKLVDFNDSSITTVESGTTLAIPYNFDGWIIVPSTSFKTEITAVKRIGFALRVSSETDNWDNRTVYFGNMHILKDTTGFLEEYACGSNGHIGDATCTEKAVCEICGAEYTDSHITEIRNATAATCSENGYTGDTWCTVCETQLSAGTVIEATGVHVDADDKFETNDTQHFYTCSCGEIFGAADHTGGTATCIEKAVCTDCGMSYGEVDTTVHTRTERRNIAEATCGATGYTGDIWCLNCNTQTGTGTTTAATGAHIGGTVTDTEKPVCDACGQEYGLLPSEFTYSVLADGTIEITGWSKSASAVVIPSTIDGYTVTSIGSEAFCHCDSLKSVTISDGIKSIGDDAFSLCYHLETVTIGKGVTSIGANAFYDCKSLESVTIPEGVTSIGYDAFCSCESLKSIIIPDSVTSIGDTAFMGCDSVTSLVIGDGVTEIGDSAFSGCDSVTSLVIGDGVTSLDSISDAFWNFPKLETVVIGSGITNIDSYFLGCDTLKSVTIRNGVTSIGDHAFQECSSLKNITIGNSVTSIGNSAFYGCSSLESIVLPDSVMSIDEWAFHSCSSLTSITIGKGVTSIAGAFDECTALTRVDISDLAAWCAIEYGTFGNNPLNYAKNLYLNGELVTELVIPDSVTTINACAFEGCTSFTSVVLPNTVTSIGEYAFLGCTAITDVWYNGTKADKENITFGASNDYLLNATWHYLNEYTYNVLEDGTIEITDYTGSETELTIPSTIDGYKVTAIGNNAFSYCESLTSVTIPDGVTSIGDSAFLHCNSLTSITIPDSVISIGVEAFVGCTSLTSVTIPDSVTSIERLAFDGCTSLTSVTLPNGITHLSDDLFEFCTSLTSITIPDSVTSIGWQVFEGCSSLENIIIPDGVTSIGGGLFVYCSALTSIIIPDGVTEIAVTTFNGCSSLKSITIPASVTSVGEYAFSECVSLTDVWYGGTEAQKAEIYIYEDSDNNNLLNATWHYNTCTGEHTYSGDCDSTCNNCDWTREATGAHTGGTATETEKAICEVCGASYGELLTVEFEVTSTETSITVSSTKTGLVYSLDKDAAEENWLSLEAFNATLTSLPKDVKYTIYAKYPESTNIVSKEVWTAPYSTHKGDGASYFMNVYDDISAHPYLAWNESLLGKRDMGWPGSYALAKNEDGTHTSTVSYSRLFLKNIHGETFIELDKCEVYPDGHEKAGTDRGCVNQAFLVNSITYNGGIANLNGATETEAGLHSSIDRTNLNYVGIRVKIDELNDENKKSSFFLWSGVNLDGSITSNRLIQDLSEAYLIDKVTGAVIDPEWTGYNLVFTGEFDGWVVFPMSASDGVTYGSETYDGKTIWTESVASIQIFMHDESTCADTHLFDDSVSDWDNKILYLGDIVVFSDKEQFNSVHAVAFADVVHSGGTATCSKKAVCTICGEEYGEFDTTAHGTNTEIRDAVDATCVDDGYTGDTWCIDCNTQIATGTVISAIGEHTGGTATCINKAVCALCGEEYGEVDTTNHANTEIRDAADATCVDGGYTGDTWCLDCNTKIATGSTIAATGVHTGGTATETEKAICDVCGEAYGELKPALVNHKNIFTVPEPGDDGNISYNNTGWNKPQGTGYYWGMARWTTTEKATAKFYNQDSVDVNGEYMFKTEVTEEQVAQVTYLPVTYELNVCYNATADNTAAGGTYEGELYGVQPISALYSDAADYNYVAIRHKIVGDTETPAYIHVGTTNANTGKCDWQNVVLINYTDNTCITITESSTTYNIPANFDGWIIVPQSQFYNSTAIENVTAVGFRYLSDTNGKTFYTGDMKIVKALDEFKGDYTGCENGKHTGGTATCSKKAVCAVCGEEYGELDTTAHGTNTEIRDQLAATCLENGYSGDTWCLDCNTIIEEGNIVPLLGHGPNTAIKGRIEATCGEDGYTGDTWCYDCNTVIETGTTIAATGAHSGGTATCINKAVCTVCGTSYGELDASAHGTNTEIRDAVNATCVDEGYTGDTWCLDCNTVIETGTTIAATGEHTGGSATETQKAVCDVCGQEYGDYAVSSDYTYNVLEDGTIEITGYTGSETELTIPSTIDGYKVTGIGNEAFYRCDSLTSITIPDGVTSIGGGTFGECSSLVSITIPDSVTSIGNGVFLNCFALTSVIIPDSVTSIGVSVFYNCSSLTSITIPDSVTGIGDYAFYNCSSLTSITIPDSVTTIGSDAFGGCYSLTSIVIPEAVTAIYDNTFYGCYSLTSITIPDGVTSIGDSAFEGCSALKDITIPDSVTSIGDFAFCECSAFKDITIPDSVTGIGDYAFCNCTSLTSITISNSVTTIGEYAFSECVSLTDVWYDGTEADKENITFGTDNEYLLNATWHYNTCIGEHTYSGDCDSSCNNCGWTRTVEVDHTYDNACDAVCNACGNTREVSGHTGGNATCSKQAVCEVCGVSYGELDAANHGTNTELRNAVEETCGADGYTGNVVCKDCGTILEKGTVISATGAHTGGTATETEKAVCEVCGASYGNYSNEADFEYTILANGTAEITGYIGDATEVIIPPSLDGHKVTSIGVAAFYNNDSITKVVIPNGVTILNSQAFYECTALAQVVIPNSVKTVDDFAFYGCTSLKRVTIPNSVTSMGVAVFENCSSLITVKLSSKLDNISASLFSNCPNLTSIVIPEAVTTIYDNAFYGCSALTQLTLPDSVEYIYYSAFTGCSSLDNVVIPENTVLESAAELFPLTTVLMVYENSPAHNYAVEFDHPYHVINKTENPDVSYGTSVGGTVKYTDGTAATGLTVQMVYADGKVKETVTTDATGKFSFTYVEIGDYTIKVTDVNGNSASSKISVKRMNDTDVFVEGDVELKLEKSYSISGTVSEGNSKVTVTDENGNVIVSVTTDANGNFTIDNLPNGSYVITAETENGSVTQEITVHNGTVTDITLEIPAESATIWGYVEIEDRDKGHNRRKWIQVTLYNQDGVAVAQCKSNSQGEYRFENVPLGNYSIVAETAEMRPDKKHGFDRNHALKGYAYVTVEAVGLIQAETIVLYEENDHLATVAGKVTAQGEAQISEVILRDVFYNEIARCTTTNNGKYVFKNVRDGMYFVTAITESYGMSFAVVVVRDGKVYGNTDIFVKKSDKIKDREDKFKNDIPELKDRNEAANYRDRIAEEKRHYDALSDKEKKQLSKEYVDRLNKYLEWLSNVTYNAVTDNENEKVTVENGGLALSGDNIENKEEITFTINVTKTDGHTASTDGIKNEQDFIHHSMQDTAGEKEIKQYYEISMTKTSGDEETKITNVYKDTGAKGKFRITMDIPEEYRGYKHYNMLHVHNGEVVTLADLDDDPNTITFEVDRFSTFALTATDETLSVEGADLKFSGASLTLQDNLAINYKVKKSLFEENGYSDPYVKFVLNGKETVVSEYRVDGDKYIFDFTDIAPYQMNDTIYATLYANFGNTLNESETREYSVAEYCYNMLNKYSADAYAEFRTLLVDLLNYGAETQTYQSYRTDALVNASLTETQKAWGTAEDPTLESVMNKEYATIENPTVTWKGAGLNLRDSITLRFKLYAENIQNLTVKITTEDGEKWTIKSREFEKTEDNYYVYFDCLSAAQMSEAVYVTVYNGDVAVSNTICYSIESYAYTKQNDEDENLSKLVKAMMKYGNSACVYYELINQ